MQKHYISSAITRKKAIQKFEDPKSFGILVYRDSKNCVRFQTRRKNHTIVFLNYHQKDNLHLKMYFEKS